MVWNHNTDKSWQFYTWFQAAAFKWKKRVTASSRALVCQSDFLQLTKHWLCMSVFTCGVNASTFKMLMSSWLESQSKGQWIKGPKIFLKMMNSLTKLNLCWNTYVEYQKGFKKIIKMPFFLIAQELGLILTNKPDVLQSTPVKPLNWLTSAWCWIGINSLKSSDKLRRWAFRSVPASSSTGSFCAGPLSVDWWLMTKWQLNKGCFHRADLALWNEAKWHKAPADKYPISQLTL